MLPKKISSITPYIIIQIEAIGNKLMETLCVPHISTESWDIWKPCSDGISLLRSYACPWTFNILNAQREHINIGVDGYKIINAEEIIQSLKQK